jgi:hypothetical protein
MNQERYQKPFFHIPVNNKKLKRAESGFLFIGLSIQETKFPIDYPCKPIVKSLDTKNIHTRNFTEKWF